MDELDAIKQVFFEECDELLVELEKELHSLSDGNNSSETINAIFRAVHSIKGGAGAFGLESLVRFSHRVESVLDDLRAGRFVANAETCKLLFQAADQLSSLVDEAKAGVVISNGGENSIAEEIEAHTFKMSDASRPISSSSASEIDEEQCNIIADLDFNPVPVSFAPSREIQQHSLILKPKSSLYSCGDDIRVSLTILESLGECKTSIIMESLPSLDKLDPCRSYLSWNVILNSEISQEEIKIALEWSFDDLGLSFEIIPPNNLISESLPPEGKKEPEKKENKHTEAAKKTIEIPSKNSTNVTKSQTSIRVDLERVDKLVDLVGELVINQASLQQWVSQLPQDYARSANNAFSGLEHLIRELQDGVMTMRAHPVGVVFQRMGRVVREASAATKKPVRLVLSGEDIEVDRSIIEHLVDPLTHILRNAVDHGIETHDERIAADKTPEGIIHLTARHRADRLVVEISDDGRGIDTERVRAKAIERGLIEEDTILDTAQIQNLIFAPGFSTASTISDISGRGVGMDVVKRTIAELGGRISMQSEFGRGTDILLSLPLTLAVLDGMIFRAGGQNFIAPIGHVVESLTPNPKKITSLSDGSLIFSVRGQNLPIVDVGAILTQTPCIQDRHVPLVLIVESENAQRMALAVNDIVQQTQIVIKSIEKNYARIPGIAAATILGNGDVALIIDIDVLASFSNLPGNCFHSSTSSAEQKG